MARAQPMGRKDLYRTIIIREMTVWTTSSTQDFLTNLLQRESITFTHAMPSYCTS